jgi:hypothetical protein
MVKPFFHTTPPKKAVAPVPTQLNSLYRQQRTLTAAKNAVVDPHIQKAIDQKQQMMGRRIAKLQTEEKTST